MIFVAGQPARDGSGNIAPEAQVPDGQMWNGTRIKLETDYLVQKRLVPALEAAGSQLGLVLKAQVYLSHGEDLAAFLAILVARFRWARAAHHRRAGAPSRFRHARRDHRSQPGGGPRIRRGARARYRLRRLAHRLRHVAGAASSTACCSSPA